MPLNLSFPFIKWEKYNLIPKTCLFINMPGIFYLTARPHTHKCNYRPHVLIIRNFPSITQLLRGRSRVPTWASLIPLLTSYVLQRMGRAINNTQRYQVLNRRRFFPVCSLHHSLLGGLPQGKNYVEHRQGEIHEAQRKRLSAKLLIEPTEQIDFGFSFY